MYRDRIRCPNNHPPRNRVSTVMAIVGPTRAGFRSGADRAYADYRYARLSGASLRPNAGTQSRDPPAVPSGEICGRLEGDRPAR